jgi:hypothetical protein
MATGPYRADSADDLLTRLRLSNGNLAVISNILLAADGRKTQLGRRIAAAAQALLAGANFEAEISRLPSGEGTQMSPSPTINADLGGLSQVVVDARQEIDYERIRVTFSAENEILHRWGMSAILPSELVIFVFDYWAKNLPQTRLDQLDDDVRALANLDGEKYGTVLKKNQREGR